MYTLMYTHLHTAYIFVYRFDTDVSIDHHFGAACRRVSRWGATRAVKAAACGPGLSAGRPHREGHRRRRRGSGEGREGRDKLGWGHANSIQSSS